MLSRILACIAVGGSEGHIPHSTLLTHNNEVTFYVDIVCFYVHIVLIVFIIQLLCYYLYVFVSVIRPVIGSTGRDVLETE